MADESPILSYSYAIRVFKLVFYCLAGFTLAFGPFVIPFLKCEWFEYLAACLAYCVFVSWSVVGVCLVLPRRLAPLWIYGFPIPLLTTFGLWWAVALKANLFVLMILARVFWAMIVVWLAMTCAVAARGWTSYFRWRRSHGT